MSTMLFEDPTQPDDGMAPACSNPRCREPLADDGTCWFCETVLCECCGDAFPVMFLTWVGGSLCCQGCA